jgi:uncharacterized protein DUF2490
MGRKKEALAAASTLGLVSVAILACSSSNTVLAQESDAVWQARPAVTTNIDFGSHARVQVFGRFEGGIDYSYRRVRTGAAFSYRMNRIMRPHRPGIDDEDEHNLVVGGGYEYLDRNENHRTTREQRVSVDATPRYLLGAGFLATDRNRVEFRWIDGTYNARYRNRLMISRPVDVNGFRFAPYATGELFYDRNLHSWNLTHYGFGAQFPWKGGFMLDTHYLHQNCTGCSRNPVNIIGATLNLYLKPHR